LAGALGLGEQLPQGLAGIDQRLPHGRAWRRSARKFLEPFR
jgi:hypothetical protein